MKKPMGASAIENPAVAHQLLMPCSGNLCMSASWQTIKEESWKLSSYVACMADVSAELHLKFFVGRYDFIFSGIPGPLLKF